MPAAEPTWQALYRVAVAKWASKQRKHARWKLHLETGSRDGGVVRCVMKPRLEGGDPSGAMAKKAEVRYQVTYAGLLSLDGNNEDLLTVYGYCT